MKILLGVDDSSCSRAAIAWVARMKWPANTKVVVVSAHHLPVNVYVDAYAPQVPIPDAVIADQRRYHEELARAASQKLSVAGLSTESRAAEGDARAVLLEAAASEHPDLLVVGSHGRSGLAKLLIGSVAHHVVTHAPCTVVVVRDAS